MATVEPFYAIRYNLKDLSPVICPPYDIVSPELKKKLLKLSPYNLIRIELPESYHDANCKFEQWLKKRILLKDSCPAFYVCQQEFTVEGKKLVRTGFFCIMKLDHKTTLKHEKVSQKPVEDRLSLMRSTGANISPIFGLFSDDNNVVKKKLKKIARSKSRIIFRDNQNLVHKLWVVTDKKFVSFLKKNLAKTPKLSLAF